MARPCAHAGCPRLTDGRWCEQHQIEAVRSKQAYEIARGSAESRGYDSDWRRLRNDYAQAHPFCEKCGQGPILVHHRHPVDVRPDLRLVWSNLISLCARCHQLTHSALRGEGMARASGTHDIRALGEGRPIIDGCGGATGRYLNATEPRR